MPLPERRFRQCKRWKPVRVSRQVVERRDHLKCVHIVGNTGETVEQLKCGCPGAKLTAIWECKLHGDCAPLARVKTLADSSVRPCLGCDDFEVAASSC